MEEDIPAGEEAEENPDYPRAQEDVNDVQRDSPMPPGSSMRGTAPCFTALPARVPEMNI